jgi:hypothetical protein
MKADVLASLMPGANELNNCTTDSFYLKTQVSAHRRLPKLQRMSHLT